MFGAGNPFAPEELPKGPLKEKLGKLRPQARAEALKRLNGFAFPKADAAKHLRVDDNGGVFIVCPINGCECDDPGHKHGETEPAPGGWAGEDQAAGVFGENIPIGDGANETFNPSSPVPVGAPPVFNSKPGAPNHIYLDFNGAYVTGKQWISTDGTTTWSTWDCNAWSTDSDRANFSISEQNAIRRMWERVAEDYAPFNVNVTTDAAYDPDNYTGNRNKVGWLLITPTTDKNGARCPHYGYGGVAYVNVFGRSDFFSRYQPAWVTPMGTANTAEAASHEMGHNMGLSHDGLTTGAAYYGGHDATSSAPSWGPIMGTGYGRNVSQWSKSSEYYNGNQSQDDLTIIAGKITYRADDHGDSFQTASAWAQSPVNQPGVVENTGDPDVFIFTTGAGPVSFNASAYRCDTQTWGANLDAVLELYDSTETLVATGNPLADTNASIATSVPAGTYYLVIKPTGTGSPQGSSPSGYSVYGSLGHYSITGTYSAVDSIFVTAPNGGESWHPGTSREITWASGVGGDVKIDLLKGGSLHSTISPSTPNDGSFIWAISSLQATGSDYRIRITSLSDPAIASESVSEFSIVIDLLTAALDTTGISWSTGGSAPWYPQTATTKDGTDAARSGAITHDQESSVSTILTGPGTLTFWWRVSSERNYDFLSFHLNGVEQTGSLAPISGTVDWVQKAVTIPAGTNTLRWVYAKDYSVNTGSDAAWLDQVIFTPDSAPEIAVEQPVGNDLVAGSASIDYGSVDVGSPSEFTFTVKNTGTANLTGLALSKSGAHGGDYSLGSLGSDSIAAGGSTTFTVTFTPSAPGTRTAALHISSNDSDENPFGINLAGTGLGPGPVDHFVISPIASPQTAGMPITGITITAQDASNATASGFTGTVTFGGTGGFSGTSASFTAGVLENASVTPKAAGSNLTLTVDDGAGHAGSIVIAEIRSVYNEWSGSQSFGDDSNSDGIPNGVAWALGATDPTANVSDILPTADSTSDPNFLTYTFRRSDAVNAAASIVCQYGGDLGSDWTTAVHDGTDIIITVSDDFHGSGIDKVEVKIRRSLVPSGRMFARLSVTPNP